MHETVKFDLLGDRRIVFDDESLTHITQEIYAVPLPGLVVTRTIVRNRPIRYDDVQLVGRVLRRQWWAQALGGLFTPLSLFWMANSHGDRGVLCVVTVFLLLLGLLPLWLFARGRPYLTIASVENAICLPLDRDRKQVRRVIALLGESLATRDVLWDREVQDLIPPTSSIRPVSTLASRPGLTIGEVSR